MPGSAGDTPAVENLFVNGACAICQTGGDIVAATGGGPLPEITNFQNPVDGFSIGCVNVAPVINLVRDLTHPVLARGQSAAYQGVAGAAVAANELAYLRIAMEQNVSVAFIGNNPGDDFSPFSIQFWFRSTLPGTYTFFVAASQSFNSSFAREFTVSRANTWEFFNIPIDDTAFPGLNVLNGIGAVFGIVLRAGADYRRTVNQLGTWISSNDVAGPNQVNLFVNNNDRCVIADLQNNPTVLSRAFSRESFITTLAKAQRYYWQTFQYGETPAAPSALSGIAGTLAYRVANGGVTTDGCLVNYPAAMFGQPVVTTYNPSAAGTNWRNQSAGANSGAAGAINVGRQACYINNTQVAGDAANQLCILHATFDGRM